VSRLATALDRVFGGRTALARATLAAAAALVVLAGVLAGVDLAEARPGGGQSFSGGSSFDGGGGGGGDGGAHLLYFLVRLIIIYPQVGVPVAIVVAVGIVMAKRKNDSLSDWDSGQSVAARTPPPDLRAIRAGDPEFSSVLFSDFVYALYARAHQARSEPGGLDGLAPYLSPSARAALAQRAPVGEPVAGVVIGGMRYTFVNAPAGADPTADGSGAASTVGIHFESNMTVGQPDSWRTYYVRETWTLSRPVGVQSLPPEKTTTFDCPNCGAVFESSDATTCSYCGETVGDGRFGWQVTGVTLQSMEARPPALISHAAERGSNLDTVYDPRLQTGLASLQADDPELTNETLLPRLILIHDELNAAWSELDLVRARPFVSDGLYNYLMYYVRAYEQEGLRNVHRDPQILRWVIAKVDRDKHYDAITVRIWGEGLDYTVESASGKIVGGSDRRVRAYSEYWTIVRGAEVRGGPRADKQCPNCGAELKISMAGVCEYCSAHITSGEFDWVLSKIEQDEAYRG